MADNFALSRYETWELDAMIQEIDRPRPWLLNTFFSNTKFFTSRTIEFDIVSHGNRLAPFVSPLAPGKASVRDGYRTRFIEPAYIKPLDLLQPADGFTRLPGEAYGGQLSPQQRFDRLVAEKLDLHQEMIDNRLEWMAAQALVEGKVVIEGEDYARKLVNFGRDSSLDIYLTGGSKWALATSKPCDDIEASARLTRVVSKGAVVTNLVMDGQTWNLLRKHAQVQDLIDIRYPNAAASSIDRGPRAAVINEPVHVGNLAGRYQLWVYDAYYQDDKGNDQPYIPPFTLLGLSNQIQGTQYYGAILDLEAGIQPVKSFTKSKLKFNPSALELVTQSAPIVAPKRPNAMFRIVVQ